MTESNSTGLEPFEGFLEMINEKIVPLTKESWDEIRPRIEKLADELEQSNEWRKVDEPSKGSVKWASLFLSIYRTLAPLCKDKYELIDLLQECTGKFVFPGNWDKFFNDRYGISENDSREEAWDKICKNFIKGGRKIYGDNWEYEQGCMDNKRCFGNILKCGFNDFFKENGAAGITRTFCVLDYLWGDALEEKYNIKLVRPTILSEGGDCCRFQFYKMENGPSH